MAYQTNITWCIAVLSHWKIIFMYYSVSLSSDSLFEELIEGKYSLISVQAGSLISPLPSFALASKLVSLLGILEQPY